MNMFIDDFESITDNEDQVHTCSNGTYNYLKMHYMF